MDIESLFYNCLQEEVERIKRSRAPFIPAWNVSEELSSQSFITLVKTLGSDKKLLEIYGSEDNIKAALLRAFDRYLINISFTGKIQFQKRLANKVFKKWYIELYNPEIENIVLASLLNFEVNKPLTMGDIEFLPVIKTGKAVELERNLYKLLGYDVKEIRRVDEFSQYKIVYFLGGNALRIRGSFKKRQEFYKYPSFPEPGHTELESKIKRFAIVLRLFKAGDFVIGSYHSAISSPFTPGMVQSGERRYTGGYQYPLVDRNEIRRFRLFATKTFPIIQGLDQLPLPIQIAVEYFNSSYEKMAIHEKFIDLMISLDALLGTQVETTYRICLRAACMLTRNKNEREDMYKKLRKALEIRGNLVHGDIHPNRINRTELEENKAYIEGIIRSLIIKLLDRHRRGTLGSNYRDVLEAEYIF